MSQVLVVFVRVSGEFCHFGGPKWEERKEMACAIFRTEVALRKQEEILKHVEDDTGLSRYHI